MYFIIQSTLIIYEIVILFQQFYPTWQEIAFLRIGQLIITCIGFIFMKKFKKIMRYFLLISPMCEIVISFGLGLKYRAETLENLDLE